MKSATLHLYSTLCVLGVLGAQASAEIFDAASSFNISTALSQPSDGWQYGYFNGGNSYTNYFSYMNTAGHFDNANLDTIAQSPSWSGSGDPESAHFTHNPTSVGQPWYNGIVLAPGALSTHPWDGGTDTLLRWTAPQTFSGVSTFQVQASMLDIGSNYVSVLKDGVYLDPGTLLAGAGSSLDETFNVTVAAGDVFEIRTSINGLDFNQMQIDGTISTVPEPAPFVVTGLGLIGLLRRRARTPR